MYAPRLALLLGVLAVTSARTLRDECSPLYGQCGGKEWTGPTCCAAGSSCMAQQGNDYYSQCLPSSGTPSTPSTPDSPSGSPTPAVFNTADPRLSQAEEAEVMKAFDTWNAALLTLDPETVADLYAPDAVLVPTLSNDVRTTHAEIADYFVLFLSKKPVGEINEYNIRLEGVDKDGYPTEVSNAGIYTFTFGDGTSTSARYTFVYTKIDGEWLIHEHHSSQLPSKFKVQPAAGPPMYKNTTDPKLAASEVQGILDAFDEWNAALATLDPVECGKMYTDDAILLPTLSDDVRTTTREIEDYFEVSFLPKKPVGHINEYNIRLESVDEIGEPLEVSSSGIYTFTYGDGTSTTARYTFIYERFRSMNPRSKWLIKQQHSSQLPQA